MFALHLHSFSGDPPNPGIAVQTFKLLLGSEAKLLGTDLGQVSKLERRSGDLGAPFAFFFIAIDLRQQIRKFGQRQLGHVPNTGSWFQCSVQVSGGIRLAHAAGDSELEDLADSLLGAPTDIERSTFLDLSNDLQNLRRCDLMHHHLAQDRQDIPLKA